MQLLCACVVLADQWWRCIQLLNEAANWVLKHTIAEERPAGEAETQATQTTSCCLTHRCILYVYIVQALIYTPLDMACLPTTASL